MSANSSSPGTHPSKSTKKNAGAKNIVLTEEQKKNFEEFLALCDKYRNSYFWSPPNGRARRYIEERDYLDYETEVNGVTYSVQFSVGISRKHYYVYKDVFRDGKRTNARVIRTLVEKATSAAESTVA